MATRLGIAVNVTSRVDDFEVVPSWGRARRSVARRWFSVRLLLLRKENRRSTERRALPSGAGTARPQNFLSALP